MPRSRLRRKTAYTPPATRSVGGSLSSRRWVAPTMVVLFVVGLLWIVTFYIAGSSLPVMRDLNNWNLLVGFGFIAAGFAVSTQWR